MGPPSWMWPSRTYPANRMSSSTGAMSASLPVRPPVCASICPPDDNEDDDGLTDSRQSLFSTRLSNGDGDGVDDEDEDD